mgnify:CR=1 FL=1
MPKLFRCVLKSKLSMAEKNGKIAHIQASFSKLHATLQVLIEECHLKGKGLYCYFVAFKKVFYTMYHEHLWRRIKELQVTMNIHLHFLESYIST